MEIENCELIQLELKYCERCGGLWIRRKGSGQIFCASCSVPMTGLMVPRKQLSRPRLPVNRRREMNLRRGGFTIVWRTGGSV